MPISKVMVRRCWGGSGASHWASWLATAIAAVSGLPRNAVSVHPYSGVNVLILWGVVIEGGYPSQDWLTFRQALAAGGCVRKGERGHTIFYADRFTPDNEREGGDTPDGEQRSIPFLKRFVVFNAETGRASCRERGGQYVKI